MRGIRSERGLTLIEVAIVMTAAFALIGALAPSMSAVVQDAKETSAYTYMGVIRDAIDSFQTDLNQEFFTINGSGTASQKTRRLVSDGDTARDRAATGSTNWQLAVDNATGLTDFLERHLVTNDPRGSVANDYTTTAVNYWRGAYVTGPIDPDPWGNRYVVNVEYLGTGPTAGNDVIVWSSGPDEQVDMPYTAASLVEVDDDLLVLVDP